MLNFKDWEKVAADKKTTTLRHKKGHEMTLAHTKLPKIQQEALKRLKFAQGTEDGTVEDKKRKEQGYGQLYSEGAPADYVAEDLDAQGKAFADKKPTTDKNAPPPVTVNVNNPGAQPPQPGQPELSSGMNPTSISSQPTSVNVPQSPQFKSALLPDESMNAPAVAQAGEQGAKLGSEIESAQAQATQKQYEELAKQSEIRSQNEARHINELVAHANALSAWNKKNGYNENDYLDRSGPGRKIGTALAILLGGAGSGITGGPNMAMEFLQKQIDRNIEGQKERFGREKTIWSTYYDLYGKQEVADKMARVHDMDMMLNKAQITAAQLGDAKAHKNLLDFQSKIIPAQNKLIMDSAGAMNSIPLNVPHGGNRSDQGSKSNREEPQTSSNKDDLMGKVIAEENRQKESPFELESSEASQEKNLLKEDEGAESPILNDRAKEIMKYELKNNPAAKDKLASIQNEYNQAFQTDAMLKQLHGVHSHLFDLAKKGGGLGYIRRHDPLEEIPFGIGKAVHKSTFEPLSNTPENKEYDSYRSRIVGDVVSALKGSPVSVEEIRRTVESNLPEPNDPPELVAKKERNIRLFIKNNIPKSQLNMFEMTN